MQSSKFHWSRFVEIALILATFALVGWWVTRLAAGKPLPVPPVALGNTVVAGPDPVQEALVSARLFGAAVQGAVSDDIHVLGIVADSNGAGGGSAVLSIDGSPPRAYRLGASVGGHTLVAVRKNEVELEHSGMRQTFRIAPRNNLIPGMTATPAAGVPGMAAIGGMTPDGIPPSFYQPAPDMGVQQLPNEQQLPPDEGIPRGPRR